MKSNCNTLRRRPAERTVSPIVPAILSGLIWLAAGDRLRAQPTILTQPTNYTACESGTATFCVEAQGTPPVTNEWRWYTTPLIYTNLPGETAACLVLTNLPAPTGTPIPRIAAVVSDASGSVTSRLATLTIRAAPSITQQPKGASVSPGATVVFSAAATTTAPPLSYQWQFHGTNLPGQTQTNLTLQNISLAQAGPYTVAVSNVCGTVVSDTAFLEVDPTFTKITQGQPVTDQEGSATATWIDYDADGYLDLFVGNAGNNVLNSLYRNNGDGSFTKITTNLLGTVPGSAWGIAWGDYDNDGKADLFVANQGGRIPSVFHNEGGGGFTRVTNGVLVGAVLDGTAALWGDYDNDGLIDLFLSTGYWSGRQNDRLFHNEGSGAFRITTAAEVGAAVNDNAQDLTFGWNDYDNDGDLDLFVIYMAPPIDGPASNFVFRSSLNGPFEKVALTDFDIARQVWGASWADYDNDGYADVFLPSWYYTNALFRNLQGRGFTNVAATAGLELAMGSQGSAWGDYDNDGWLDLFVGNYEGQAHYPGGQALFHNNHDGTFTRITSGSPAHEGGRTTGVAWGDYDNDGFLDVYIACGDATPQRNLFYRNNGNSNHWLKVKLDGRVSNRLGIGAKVRVQATIGGRNFWQLRTISGQHSLVAESGLLAHFGLGDATNVETLRVEWPSGQVTELHDVAVRQSLTITEAPGLRIAPGTLQLQITAHTGMNVGIEVSSNLVNWVPWQIVPQTNRTVIVTDPEASQHPRRFYKARVQ